jgi:hypothetical protein
MISASTRETEAPFVAIFRRAALFAVEGVSVKGEALLASAN